MRKLQANRFQSPSFHMPSKFVDSAIYLYIGIPILIFLLGWIKWFISIPVSILILFSLYKCIKNSNAVYPALEKKNRSVFGIVILLAFAWVYLSGVGGFTYQNYDHLWRNEIFRILVRSDWPVQKEILVGDATQTKFISYYIGFWLPAALFGKIFGLMGGFLFQALWAALGIVFVFVKMSEFLGHCKVSILLIFIFFSGLDIAGCALLGENIFGIDFLRHLELWSGFDYQFSSHTTQLFWVFNQAIYGWLLTMMILNEKENKNLILIWSCGLLECTFPFVGMIPFLVYRVIANCSKESFFQKNTIIKNIKNLFTFENIIGGGFIGIISFLYLYGSNDHTSTKAAVNIITRIGIYKYILFVMVEAGIYYFVIHGLHRNKPLYYISLVSLLLCPLIRVGNGIDFSMRASIPGLLVLCLLVTKSLFETWKTNKVRFFVILLVVLIGSITPLHEFFRTTVNSGRMGEQIEYVSEEDVYTSVNFTGVSEDSVFMKYLAK